MVTKSGGVFGSLVCCVFSEGLVTKSGGVFGSLVCCGVSEGLVTKSEVYLALLVVVESLRVWSPSQEV